MERRLCNNSTKVAKAFLGVYGVETLLAHSVQPSLEAEIKAITPLESSWIPNWS